MKAFKTTFVALTLGGLMAFTGFVSAQDAAEAPAEPVVDPRAEAAANLDQLLRFVEQGQTSEARENKAREDRFAQAKADKARLLKEAEAERERQERLSTRLEKQFEDNELLIAAKQQQLKEKLGALTELFCHLTAAAGDLSSNIEVSLVSSQHPNREEFLKELIAKMSGSDKLPRIGEIERVWY